MNQSEKQEEILEIVKTVAQNGILGRWDVVRPFIADDIVLHVPPSLPWGGDRHGWEGYQGALMAMGGFFAEFRHSPLSFHPLGEMVVIMTEISGRVAETGKPFAMPLLEVWTVKDRKISDIVAYFFDTECLVG